MRDTKRHILYRSFLLFLLLGLLRMQAGASDKGPHLLRALFEHELTSQLNIPQHFLEDTPEEGSPVVQTKYNRRKPRFWLTVSNQKFSFTSRLPQLEYSQLQRVPGHEKMAGVYGQDVFLPAYYTFLFRYTPF